MKNIIYKKGKVLFGFVESDFLYTKNGTPAGKVLDTKVYGPDGSYIGEINIYGELVFNKKNIDYAIEKFEQPKMKSPLGKKYQIIGITKLLGTITRPTPCSGSDELEFPDSEEIDNLYRQ